MRGGLPGAALARAEARIEEQRRRGRMGEAEGGRSLGLSVEQEMETAALVQLARTEHVRQGLTTPPATRLGFAGLVSHSKPAQVTTRAQQACARTCENTFCCAWTESPSSQPYLLRSQKQSANMSRRGKQREIC